MCVLRKHILKGLIECQFGTSHIVNHTSPTIFRCFMQHAAAMKTAYTDYCVNHDKAEQLMEKYESTPDISRLLQRGVETIQAQVSCFNMGSVLIKPVQ